MVGIFFPELQSPNPLVRQAAQNCIGLLVNLSGRPAIELLMPHRDRMLVGISLNRSELFRSRNKLG